MCSFIFSTKEIKNIIEANLFSKNRGPDKTCEYLVNDKYHFVHNLLSITGDFKTQPFVKNDIYCVFNGQIYNYKEFNQNYSSDGECLIDLYEKFGFEFIKKLDGEFAIVLLDLKKEILVISSDVFGTKPIWIGKDKNNNLGVATYKSSLVSEGFEDIRQCPPNASFLINLKNNQMIKKDKVYQFDLNQHKEIFTDWINAFENSISKRINSREKIFIGLSSGYDSGAIACELIKQSVDFNSFSIAAAEDVNIIYSRMEKIEKSMFIDLTEKEYNLQKLFLEKNSERYFSKPRKHRPRGYLVTNDKGAVGTGIICELAKNKGCKIYLSGQGSDEILSDYGHNGKMAQGFIHGDVAGYYPENLEDIFPWTNFFFGTQREFLYKDEAVGGTYGIECRYPFLDKSVVQEFLWLKNDLKNCYYKAPIREYLVKNDFPFNEGLKTKVGFRANNFRNKNN